MKHLHILIAVLVVVIVGLLAIILQHNCECTDGAKQLEENKIVEVEKSTIKVLSESSSVKIDIPPPKDVDLSNGTITRAAKSRKHHRSQPRAQWQTEAASNIQEAIGGIVAHSGGWVEDQICEFDKCRFTFKAYSGGYSPDNSVIAILNALKKANIARGNGEKVMLQFVNKEEEPWSYEIHLGRFSETFPEVNSFLKGYIDAQEALTKEIKK
jgi:hypothetical protein